MDQPEDVKVYQKVTTTYQLLSQKYPEMISVNQLSEILNIARKTIRHWLSHRRLPVPVVRIGNNVRFRIT